MSVLVILNAAGSTRRRAGPARGFVRGPFRSAPKPLYASPVPNGEDRQPSGYVVLRQVEEDLWQLVAEADRQPGRNARNARGQAVVDATKGDARPEETYAVVLRSEWRIALDH